MCSKVAPVLVSVFATSARSLAGCPVQGFARKVKRDVLLMLPAREVQHSVPYYIFVLIGSGLGQSLFESIAFWTFLSFQSASHF